MLQAKRFSWVLVDKVQWRIWTKDNYLPFRLLCGYSGSTSNSETRAVRPGGRLYAPDKTGGRPTQPARSSSI